jgi:hypothetical protein
MRLNDHQIRLLTQVAQADQHLRISKISAQAMAKLYKGDLLAPHLRTVDLAVRVAFNAGVPSVRICQEGLGTKSPSAVKESLARTAGFVRATEAIADITARENDLKEKSA